MVELQPVELAVQQTLELEREAAVEPEREEVEPELDWNGGCGWLGLRDIEFLRCS